MTLLIFSQFFLSRLILFSGFLGQHEQVTNKTPVAKRNKHRLIRHLSGPVQLESTGQLDCPVSRPARQSEGGKACVMFTALENV